MRGRVVAAAIAALSLSLTGACSSGSDDPPEPLPTAADLPEPPPVQVPPIERADKLPELPRGWSTHMAPRLGLALGRPPGWTVVERDGVLLMRSPERLVAVTIAIDREPESQQIPLDGYLDRVARALPGYERALRPSKPRGFPSHYRGIEVRAEAIAEASGIRQRLRLVALRRPGIATILVVIAANAKEPAPSSADQAQQLVRTIRTRPPERGRRRAEQKPGRDRDRARAEADRAG